MRYRPRHGIDGLVLAISADRLKQPDKDALIAEGSVVRERIEQLIRMFGKRFPIYVLVTKCDQLYGMAEWAQQLAMGTDTDTLEAKLKQSYLGNYRKYILSIYVGNSEDDFAAAMAPGASNASVAALMRNLVRRINLLKARCHGADRAALHAMPQEAHSQHWQDSQHSQHYTPQQFDQLNTLMLSYLAWMAHGLGPDRRCSKSVLPLTGKSECRIQ
jgi:hypothetical protein